MPMYLAGDIGGTKTALALFQPSGEGLEQVREQSFPSHEFATFDAVLAAFLKESAGVAISTACFGVAGAIVEGRVRTTNLPWVLDEQELASRLKARRVKLLNDLEAAAYSVLFLKPEELAPLNPDAGPPRKGNAGVIAAGTGLGEAILYWDGSQYHPIASEGGHGDFGPRSDLEIELLRYLRQALGGHVSYERVLSGPGLHNIYMFLRDSGHVPESDETARALEAGDPNATIAMRGVAGSDPLCTLAVDLFCAIYGAEAGNLALRSVAVGGIYVAGGIAPKLLPALRRGGFMASFREKGRFTEFLRGIEVNVALNPRAPLLGAGYYALRLGSENLPRNDDQGTGTIARGA